MHRLLPLLALLALLAGCGASNDSSADFEGAEADVAQVIEDLEEAGQDDDPRRICSEILSRELVQQIEQNGDCVDAIDKALSQTDTFAMSVESIRVTGTTARARVKTGVDEEEEELIELQRQGQDWRISGLPGA